MSQAARLGDQHTCPAIDPGPKPHGGGPIIQGEPTVLIEGQPAARVGDRATCMGPPDTISRGAFPVSIGGQPAARVGDPTAHGGVIVAGAATVFIGAAGISGNPWVGETVFKEMAAGRKPPPGSLDPNGMQLQSNTPGQSYNNCGVEVSRQLINQAARSNLSQEGLLNQAMINGWASQVPGDLYQSGATMPAQRVAILQANGVPAIQMAPTAQNLELAVAQGRGVSVDVWAGNIWPPSTGLAPGTGAHNILVTGVEYDAAGNPMNVIVNDTGIGTSTQRIPVATLQNALIGGANNHVVTVSPIW